jgi:deoxyribonuclease-4
MGLLFGTGGTPLSTKEPHKTGAIRQVRSLGLNALEMEWVQGTPPVSNVKSLTDALEESHKEPQVVLSAHGSYYVNLAGEKDVIEKSRERIFKACWCLWKAGGRNVVFHPAFYQKLSPEETHKMVVESLRIILAQMETEKIEGVLLRPETTGKPTQYGSLDEILRLSVELPNTRPTIDFAHLHARSGGKFNTYDEFCSVLEAVHKSLGNEGLQDLHVHMSGIEYTAKGERKHLPLEESDMNWRDLFKAFKSFDVSGTIICESPILEQDALLMQEYYKSL